MELGSGDLGADVDDRTLRLERLADEREHGRAPLEQLDEPHRRLDLLHPRALDESGRPADEDLGPASAPTSSSVCPMSARNARSRGASSGASRRRRTVLEPRRSPTSWSSRYSPAQATRPGSTGSSSRNTRFVTPPVDVMTTTMTLVGWSARTSM